MKNQSFRKLTILGSIGLSGLLSTQSYSCDELNKDLLASLSLNRVGSIIASDSVKPSNLYVSELPNAIVAVPLAQEYDMVLPNLSIVASLNTPDDYFPSNIRNSILPHAEKFLQIYRPIEDENGYRINPHYWVMDKERALASKSSLCNVKVVKDYYRVFDKDINLRVSDGRLTSPGVKIPGSIDEGALLFSLVTEKGTSRQALTTHWIPSMEEWTLISEIEFGEGGFGSPDQLALYERLSLYAEKSPYLAHLRGLFDMDL